MFTKALLPDTVRAIQLVSKIPTFQGAYLAGGTALALIIGHRISVDLDFFTLKPFDENELSSALHSFPEFNEQRRAWRTILGKIGETSVSLFYYEYPLLGETSLFEGLQIADKKDLAAMKINAIEDRGTKRDFVDLYFLAKEFSLEQMFTFYDQKYACLKDHLYLILRSLNYFADADSDERPLKMLIDAPWEEVKEFFLKESARLAREKLGG